MENIAILLICLAFVFCAPIPSNDTSTTYNTSTTTTHSNDTSKNENTLTTTTEAVYDDSCETVDLAFFETFPDSSDEEKRKKEEEKLKELEWEGEDTGDDAEVEEVDRFKRHAITWSFDGQGFNINRKKAAIWQDETKNQILENEVGLGIGWSYDNNGTGYPKLNNAKARVDFTNRALGAAAYASAEVLPNNGGERIGTGFNYNLFRAQRTNIDLAGNYALNFLKTGKRSDYSMNIKMDF